MSLRAGIQTASTQRKSQRSQRTVKKNITVYAKWEKVVVKKGAVKKVTVTGTSKTLSKLSKGRTIM